MPLYVGITHIDHRLTDLLFASTGDLDQILTAEVAIDGDAWKGRVARWLSTGQVVFDSILLSYFRIRKLPWEGDKAAIRYLMAHDRPYFDLLQEFLREPDPHGKFAAYERIAAATLVPLGSLWSGEPTVLWNVMLPATCETVEQGLAFWETLLHSDDT